MVLIQLKLKEKHFFELFFYNKNGVNENTWSYGFEFPSFSQRKEKKILTFQTKSPFVEYFENSAICEYSHFFVRE